MSELKAYTEEELAEYQQLYDEIFTPVWESEGQYCRAGGGQYEKSFAWWAFKNQQSKVDELQKQLIDQGQRFNEQAQRVKDLEHKNAELQKRVDASLIAFEKLKEEINELHGQCDLHLIKYLEEKSQVLEQALKGEQP